MSYQALYRKYRPSTLEDVIGQDVVIKILKNAIISNKIGHAYLFSGPRGIGKTTIAKAIAKTVNCLNPINGVSCEKCENCKSINEGANPDIIEIDAASNNGINEIREIKNKINFVPSMLKYKVYIIDEVHMLSIEAFNALLKTLEEPPSHVIFILATTDVQKVPATIISRCQTFDFHRISDSDIISRLKYIVKNEKIKIDDDVLSKIAFLSDGGLRDSIGMLDKLTSYSNDKITIDDFEKINGIVSVEDKEIFINYIYETDVKKIIEFIDKIYDCGKDLVIFVQDLLKLCKDKIIEYYTNNENVDVDFLIALSNRLNSLLKQIKETTDVKTLFEINILSYINDSKFEKTDNQKAEKSENNVNIKNEAKPVANIEKQMKPTKGIDDLLKNNKIIVNNCLSKAKKDAKEEFITKFNNVSEYVIDSELGYVANFVSDGSVCATSSDEVIISFLYESMVNRGLDLNENVQKLFEKMFNKKYDIAYVTNEQWEEIKKKYAEDKKKGIVYKYIPLEAKKTKKEVKEESKKNDATITNQAIDWFGENMISVEEKG